MKFAEDLAKAFDADGDAQCSLDFEEFFLLYEEYFSPERLGSLREKVVVGYLTEEEAAAYEKEQEAMVRANQRLLEMHEMRHHVKVRQQQQFVDQMEAGHLSKFMFECSPFGTQTYLVFTAPSGDSPR